MVRRLALALAFCGWAFGAFAQGLPAHTIPIGEGLTQQGWGIGGPCTANQTLLWSNNTTDPACGTPTSTPALSIGTVTVTGGMDKAVLDLSGTTLTQIVPFPNEVFITNAGSLAHLSTTLPSGITHPNPVVTGQYSGANTIPLSSLLQLSPKSVVGNLGAAAGNVTAPWVVPNSIDGLIPLIHTTPSLVASDLVCFNDTSGTQRDCGVSIGGAASWNIGVSGAVIGLLNAALHFSGANVEFSNGVNFTAGSFQVLSKTMTFPGAADTLPGLTAGATWTGKNTFATVAVTMSLVTVGATPGSPAIINQATDYGFCFFKTVGATSQINLPTTHSTGDTYLVKDCKGDDVTNPISVATTNSDLIDGFNATTNPYKMNTSTASATQASYDRAAFTWSGNSSVGWIVN